MIGLGLLCVFLDATSAEFNLKLSGGAGRLDGGDLNRSITGWKSYYQDRASPSFSSSYGLKELRFIQDLQAELTLRLSPRWSVGLSVGYIPGITSGDVSTLLSEEEMYTLPSGETGTASLTEDSTRGLRYELKAVPVLATIYRSFPLRDNLELTLGAGGGLYFGRYTHREESSCSISSIDNIDTAAGPVQYFELYELAGEYTEKASAVAFGAHGLIGFEYRMSPSLALIFEVVGRWAGLDGWKGQKTDAYEWSQTWEYGTRFFEEGEFEESADGKLWRVDARGAEASGTYPRLLFGDEAPASSSYSNVRPARINFGGVSARIGFRFRFGEKR